MYSSILPLAILLFASLASAANFGSCNSSRRCGFMCCDDTEECVQEYCVGAAFVSTAILGDAATSKYPSLTNARYRSSVISVLQESGGVSSVYSQFKDIMTNAPSPSPLGTDLPTGVTVPSTLPTGRTTKAATTPSPTSSGKASEVPSESQTPTSTGTGTTTRGATTAAGATTTTTGAAARGSVAIGAVVIGVLGAVVAL